MAENRFRPSSTTHGLLLLTIFNRSPIYSSSIFNFRIEKKRNKLNFTAVVQFMLTTFMSSICLRLTFEKQQE